MATLADILALNSQQNFDSAVAAPPPPIEKSNLRAGALDLRASINNAMALGAENLGAIDTSNSLRAEAAVARQQAEQYGTTRQKTTTDDVQGVSDAWNKGQMGAYVGDTLHNLPSTLVRGAAGMAGPVVAGMAGGAVAGPAGALLAGSAAMLPQTAGDIAERQYANPDNKDSAGLRAVKALGYGGASALAQNVVPQWMGGKLVGAGLGAAERGVVGGVARTAEGAVANKALATVASTPARPTLAGSIARNLSESIGGNAVAGGAAELANQMGAGEQIDTGKIGTAAVEGGVLGTAFAPLGVAGEMIHRGPSGAETAAIAASRKARGLNPDGTPMTPEQQAATAAAPAAPDPAGLGAGGAGYEMPPNADIPPSMRPQGPPKPSPAQRKAARDAAAAAPTEAPTTGGSAAPVQDLLDKAKAGSKGIAEKLAAGEPLMDNAQEFIGAVGDKATQMYDKGKATATAWVQKAAQEYVKRRDLTAEQRATAEKAAANPADEANHQAMGLLATDLKKHDFDASMLDELDKDFPEEKAAPGSKQSASTAGVDKRIAAITEPYLKGKSAENITRANAVMRRMVASAAKGEVNEPAIRRLNELLGPQAHQMAQRVYDAVAPREAVADARMARHINRMQVIGERDRGLGKVIDENLPEDHNINVTHLKEALMRWARGDDDIGADARGKVDHAAVREDIKNMFGKNADKVFDALETYANREDDKPGSTQNIKHDKDALDRGDMGSRRGDIAQEAGADFGDLDEGKMDPIYYGGGSNPLAMNQLIESPEVYRAKHEREGPAERMIKKLLGNDELPEDMGGSGHRNIRWISERDYNRRHGIREPVVTADGHETGETEATGSTTHGYIVHEESNDPTKFNDNDFAATRLDMKKYGRSAARINIDSEIKPEKNSKGEKMTEGQKAKAIDAVRLTERFMRNQETGTGDPNVVRSGKAFMDGILALQEKLQADGDPREFIDEKGLEKLVADGEIPKDAKLEEYGLVLLPDSLKIDKEGNTYGGMKQALRQIAAKDIKDERAALKLTKNEQEQLLELRKGFKQQTKEEQALRLQEAEDIYRNAKGRAKDFELSGDRENDLTRRKTSMENKGNEGVAGVAKTSSTFATGEGDVIKGYQKDGSPIYDLSARTQAEAWFDAEGVAKASKAIDQLGDVHGGIDTGRVQEKARHNFIERIRAKANEEKRPISPREQAAIDRIQTRNEARTAPDARTGKEPMFDADGKQRAFDSSGSGRTEVSPDENPHLVSAVEGDDMKRGMNMDDTPQSIDRSKAFKDEEEKRTLIMAAARLADTGNQQEKAAGRKIGARMSALIENADSMSLKDVNRLKRVGEQINMGKLKAADASTVVNELARKYSATIVDNKEVRENPRGFVERVVRTSHGGEDSAGEPTQPVATRPVPPEAPVVKKGNKAYEGHNKGTPTAMLKEQLGTHSDTLNDPVARIQQALEQGDTPEVDMKTPKGRKAVSDFAKSTQDFEVSYDKDGKPTFTRTPLGEFNSSLGKMRTESKSNVDMHALIPISQEVNAMYAKGASAAEIAAHAGKAMDALADRAAKVGTADAHKIAQASIHAIQGMVEQLTVNGDNPKLNEAVHKMLTGGDQPLWGKLKDAWNNKVEKPTLGKMMDAYAEHGSPIEKVVARAVKRIVPDTPVTTEASKMGELGSFVPDTNTVNVTSGILKRASGTLLHEGVHAATIAGLANNPTLLDASHMLLKHVMEQDEGMAHRYASTNSLEFVAEAMSNPAIQERLRKIPASNEVKGVLGNVKNMWDAFVTVARKALGIGDEHHNALTQMLEVTGAAMRETQGKDPTDSVQKLYDTHLPSLEGDVRAGIDKWRDTMNLNDRGKEALDIIQKKMPRTFAHLLAVENPSEAELKFREGQLNGVNTIDSVPAGDIAQHFLRSLKLDADTAHMTHGWSALPSETEGTPRPKAGAAKTAALDKAVTSSDPALLHELRTTDNIHGLQRTVDHLIENHPDSKALEAANERMSEIAADPDQSYQMQLESKQNASTANNAQSVPGADRMDIRDHIAKVLGPNVKVAFKKIFHEGDFTPLANTPQGVADLIRISIHSMDPWSTAYHESMHGFINNMRKAGLHDISNVLQKAADSEYVRKEMERIVGKDPAAMAQLRGADPEERVAYMYQMWANGQLKLDGKPATFFSKLFKAFREITGIWTNDDRATHIMDYFHSGEYAKDMGNRDLVMAKTMEVHSGLIGKAIKAVRVPYDAMSDSVIAAGGQKVRNTNNPHLNRLVDLIKPKPGDTKSGDVGYIRSSRLAKTTYMNKFAAEMQTLSKEQQDQVLESLQTTIPAASPEARIAARNVRTFLQEMHKYITDSGVEIGNLDSSYFPRVWDSNAISKDQKGFRTMLDKYVKSGDMSHAEADEFMYKLIRNGGNEFDVDTLRPGFQANKERVYSFIEHEDAAAFQSKDLFRTVNDYVTQATRRAEWTRRFSGDDAIEKIFDRAKATGATVDDLAATRRYLQGITGVLGDDMNPTLRRLQGNVMVYQNIRLLPMAIFSSIVDPQGIIARGGKVGEAFQAFKYGISQIPNNLRGIPKTDVHAQLAETMGTIENAMLAGTLGESYQQGMVGETGRKINDKFFKYNLMEGWNRSMRIAATHAAINFIHTHADGTASKHSARFMDEMGLGTQDIHYKADGSLKLHEGDGLTPEQANKMRVAVNNWVDGAILRPDAADKPTWAHDPRFALLFHLKQFTYSFQSTMLDRMWNEAKNGNFQPMLGLASYVPVMIAADALKGFLLTGGVPDRKKDWGVKEYVNEGYERAGLHGVGQYQHDVIKEWHKGNTGLGAVRGPTLDQLTEAIDTMRGRESFGTFAMHSLPANKVITSH